MKFLKQIKFEMRNIIKSKFLLIIGILVLVASIASPVISRFTQNIPGGGGIIRPLPMGVYAEKVMYSSYGYYGDKFDGEQESIVVNGVTILNDNPFFWNLQSLMQEKSMLEVETERFSSPAALDLALKMMDAEIDHYVRFARYILTYQDYRTELAWRSLDSLYDRFIFEHNDVEETVLIEAVNYRRGMDHEAFKKKYIDITATERQAALIKADETIQMLFAVVENNDFPTFIDLRIQQERDTITSLRENIEIQEEAIVRNPSQEESINQIIEEYKRQIMMIEENNIPILELRKERNIVPGAVVWHNNAISDIENNRNQLLYTTKIPEEQFNKDKYLLQQYGNYRKYESAIQAQINQFNNNILIAERSLNADKPDMKYVTDGSRNRTVQFLDFSVVIALFGVLLGGWLMASEYQQGTIRLLMIRPKTRTKILLSKFVAAFALCLGMYAAGSVLNMVTNGICFGFSDFGFPNYTVAGETGFLLYYLPKFAACITTIVFGFTVAFMLSVLVKNIAVSIAVPIVCFVGSLILLAAVAYRSAMDWIAYTPVPYLQISSFFTQYSAVQSMIQRGVPLSMPYGIMMMLALSAVCTFVSILVFRKRDITN